MRIGIDLGGTKTEGVVIDSRGIVQIRKRVATPAHSYSAIITTIAELVGVLEAEVGSRCVVGLAMPGSIAPGSGLVRNANTVVLIDRALGADLKRVLKRPVRLENDANCFVVSEAIDGAATGARSAFGVIIGTGTGGGIWLDGKLLTGWSNNAGEWGHNPLPWMSDAERDNRVCYCGKLGCIETFLSGSGLRQTYQNLGGTSAHEPAHIVRQAEAGDPISTAALEIYVDQLGRGLASVINIIDPEVVVLGGGLSNIDSLYDRVPKAIDGYVFSDGYRGRIARARHGDSSGVLGAANLWTVAEGKKCSVAP
ncbi:MAG: ROK family protein [Pseudomonadota bacterium]